MLYFIFQIQIHVHGNDVTGLFVFLHINHTHIPPIHEGDCVAWLETQCIRLLDQQFIEKPNALFVTIRVLKLFYPRI